MESKKFKIKKIDTRKDLSTYRYTIDTEKDFKLFCQILKKFKFKRVINLKMEKLIEFINNNLSLYHIKKN